MATLGVAVIFELLADCDRQLKHQYSIMVDGLTPVGGNGAGQSAV